MLSFQELDSSEEISQDASSWLWAPQCREENTSGYGKFAIFMSLCEHKNMIYIIFVGCLFVICLLGVRNGPRDSFRWWQYGGGSQTLIPFQVSKKLWDFNVLFLQGRQWKES